MPWTDVLYPWLIHSALVSLIVLVIGSVAVVFCRQPVRQARIIELTLAGCLVAPCLGMVPGYPQFAFTWPQSPWLVASDPGGMPFAQPVIELSVSQTEPPAFAVSAEPSEPGVQGMAVRASGIDVPLCVVGAYLLGIGLGLAWWLAGIVGLARIVAAARPASPRCRELFREISEHHGGRVRLLVSRRVGQPFAAAWWRPVIVLPEGLCADERSLRWSLAHEWSHVKRHDFRAWLLAGLARVILCYQPLVWWLRRRLRLAQDFLADAQAARHAPQPEDYAEFLTFRAAAGSPHPALAALGIGFRKSELYRRVIMLVQNRSLESRVPRLWSAAMSIAALVLVAAVAAFSTPPHATAEEDSSAAPPQPAAVASEAKTAPAAPTAVPAGGPFKAKLPNGAEVEIVAIGEVPREE